MLGATGENLAWIKCTLFISTKPVICLAQQWTCIKSHNPFTLSASQTKARVLADVFQQTFFPYSTVSNESPFASQENLSLKHLELTFQIHFLCKVCRKWLVTFKKYDCFSSFVGKTWGFLTTPRDRYITALHSIADWCLLLLFREIHKVTKCKKVGRTFLALQLCIMVGVFLM